MLKNLKIRIFTLLIFTLTFSFTILGCGGGGEKVGSILVTSTPAGAKIYLDGNDTGKLTPATIDNVKAGTHTLKLTKTEGKYKDWSQTVNVSADQTTTITVTLEPLPPDTSGEDIFNPNLKRK
jgi:hypothetical protein